MNLGVLIWNVERTWLRRILALLYVIPGILYNVLWHGPKQTLSQCVQFTRAVWAHRHPTITVE